MSLTYEFIRKITAFMRQKYRESREAYEKEKEKEGFKVVWVHELCLEPNTRIFTTTGFKPIRDIKVGDYVLTSDGKFRRVTKVFKRKFDGELYKLKPSNLPPVLLTGNHPVLVRFRKHGKKRAWILGGEKWVTVEELKKLHEQNLAIKNPRKRKTPLVLLPINNDVVDIPELDEDKCKILGYFITEGNFEKRDGKCYKVIFNLGYHEAELAERIKDIVCKLGYNATISVDERERKYRRVRVYSKDFASFIRKYCEGNRAPEKRFKPSILFLPPQKQSIIFEAMLEGDGGLCKRGNSTYAYFTTSSKDLALQTLYMNLRMGRVVGYSERVQKGWGKGGSIYQLNLYLNKRKRFANIINETLYACIREITPVKYSGEVYNLEVEGNHTYVAEGIVVHNCECSLKRSMREKFPEIYESAEFNPRFIVGELIHLAFKFFYPSEDRIFEKAIKIGDTNFLIAGTPDVLVDDKFLEIKYMTTYYELPLEHHVMQAKLYRWLTGKDGEIIYITPDGIKGYPIKDAYTDEEVKKIIAEPKSPMWVDWECSLCVYRSYCPQEIRKK